MFITWPDMWYHSSQDTPDKQDATQYKRGAVVGIGAMTVLATGGDVMASRVVAENLARGTSRMGASQVKGVITSYSIHYTKLYESPFLETAVTSPLVRKIP